jgi:SOS response regulatory protein OraA/RecX
VEDAYADAVRMLARRPLARRELFERLRERGHAEGAIDDAVARLEEQGSVNDVSLARHWIETRSTAAGRGRERTIGELVARGVDEVVAEAAWREAQRTGAIDDDALLACAVRRRLGPAPGRADRGRLARVYNALLSEGFEREAVVSALAVYGLERNDP